MERIGIIELEGMEFKAYHGCLEQEKVRGNVFTVDFRGELDLSAAAESDNLSDTLNYGEIYDIVADEMSIPSELLENVAGRIVDEIEKRFPQLQSFSIRVSTMLSHSSREQKAKAGMERTRSITSSLDGRLAAISSVVSVTIERT